MAVLDLTLTNFKFPNVSDFVPNFGTKVTTNSGSLTTKEICEDLAKIYDQQRPIEVTENSSTGEIQFNAYLTMNSATSIILTLGNGAFIGVKCKIKNTSAVNHIISAGGINYSIKAGTILTLVWNDTTWEDELLMNESRGILSCTTNANLAPVVTGYGLGAYYDGLAVKVRFSKGHYGDSFTFEINNLGALPVYALKDGVDTLMVSHALTRGDEGEQNWYCQPCTLELLYISDIDGNGNAGWEVQGNPVVLSKSSDTEGYTVYADGWIKQRIRRDTWQASSGEFYQDVSFLLPFYSAEYFCTITLLTRVDTSFVPFISETEKEKDKLRVRMNGQNKSIRYELSMIGH